MNDRRKLMHWQIAGDDFFANLRMNFAQGVQWQPRLLATRGERLALFHVLETFDGEAGGVGRAESEFLWLVEVDAEGRCSVLVIFDPDDQGDAYAELGARFAEISTPAAPDPMRIPPNAATRAGEQFRDYVIAADWDALRELVAAIVFDPADCRAASADLMDRHDASDADESRRASRLEFMDAIRDHDLDRVRATMPEGFVYHDHRRIGAGRLEGEAYIAWMAGLFEQSPDALIAPLYVIAREPHATLLVGHTFGTRVEGGAFESVYVTVAGILRRRTLRPRRHGRRARALRRAARGSCVAKRRAGERAQRNGRRSSTSCSGRSLAISPGNALCSSASADTAPKSACRSSRPASVAGSSVPRYARYSTANARNTGRASPRRPQSRAARCRQ
jgi:hypothetical protein